MVGFSMLMLFVVATAGDRHSCFIRTRYLLAYGRYIESFTGFVFASMLSAIYENIYYSYELRIGLGDLYK